VGLYIGAPAVLHTEASIATLAGRTVYAPQYLAEYGLSASSAPRLPLTYDGLLFDSGAVRERTLPIACRCRRFGPKAGGPSAFNEANDVANGFRR
jgi:hypothetical protein